MNHFKVIEIIDATTIRVTPSWVIENGIDEYSGDRVVIKNLRVDKYDHTALTRLSNLLLNKDVELSAPTLMENTITENSLVACFVMLENVNVSYYFPEYNQHARKHA